MIKYNACLDKMQIFSHLQLCSFSQNRHQISIRLFKRREKFDLGKAKLLGKKREVGGVEEVQLLELMLPPVAAKGEPEVRVKGR